MERIRLRRFDLPSPHANNSGSRANDSHDGRHHLSTADMKHTFALQPLNERAFGGAREFLCHCIRCKWTFQVNPDRGSIMAFNNVGEPLEGPEAAKRIATFAEGPCPAFVDFPEYDEVREARKSDGLLRHLLGILGLDSAAG